MRKGVWMKGAPPEIVKFGIVPFRQYPFMPSEYLHRSHGLIASTNAKLQTMGAPCVLRSSNIDSRPKPPILSKRLGILKSLKDYLGLSLSNKSDTLGLFATSDIPKGSVIFKDSTALCAFIQPTRPKMKSSRQEPSHSIYTNCFDHMTP